MEMLVENRVGPIRYSYGVSNYAYLTLLSALFSHNK